MRVGIVQAQTVQKGPLHRLEHRRRGGRGRGCGHGADVHGRDHLARTEDLHRAGLRRLLGAVALGDEGVEGRRLLRRRRRLHRRQEPGLHAGQPHGVLGDVGQRVGVEARPDLRRRAAAVPDRRQQGGDHRGDGCRARHERRQ
ncbi:hypothetical protein SCOCK_10296 [Actinacidiphila cocklensis]|uniref:Uncharacterized protein n=1 Tax=Actinacidiphila cocklensis TaxID=887465 RepID=A0A9W4E046_9ACTN|nr:hypothetical protein SCOCK_10296 [Actinacidiphila cocklensis]